MSYATRSCMMDWRVEACSETHPGLIMLAPACAAEVGKWCHNADHTKSCCLCTGCEATTDRAMALEHAARTIPRVHNVLPLTCDQLICRHD